MRLSFITDPHLNFIVNGIDHLVAQVKADHSDALLITGDIGEANTVIPFLEKISEGLPYHPVFFVLGNHDFFNGSIHELRLACKSIGQCTSLRHLRKLHYLATQVEPIELTPTTALIGHDGWADARSGNYDNSPIELNDHKLIRNFAQLTKDERHKELHRLGDEASAHVQKMLLLAFRTYTHVILATHIPPFAEACVNAGSEWLPHLVCTTLGETLLRIMDEHPSKRLTVYCGHTHTAKRYSPLSNLEVNVGSAQVGHIHLQPLIQL